MVVVTHRFYHIFQAKLVILNFALYFRRAKENYPSTSIYICIYQVTIKNTLTREVLYQLQRKDWKSKGRRVQDICCIFITSNFVYKYSIIHASSRNYGLKFSGLIRVKRRFESESYHLFGQVSWSYKGEEKI